MAKPSKFKRSPSNLELRTVFIVALEGEKTEYMYFNALKKEYNSRTLHIDPLKPDEGTSPKQVVSRAAKRKAGKSDSTTYWAVVDHDGRTTAELSEAIELAEKLGVRIIFSVPLFEYWLLLHTENPKPSSNKNVCYKQMAKLMGAKEYVKGSLKFDKIVKNVELAVTNARRLQGNSDEIIPLPHGTRVHILIEEIIRVAKLHNK